jgi:ribosomal protein S18 acetylase RimI-like enzyme
VQFNIRKCTLADLPVLHEIAVKTFVDTFGHLNSPLTMQAYLDDSFNPEKLQEELADGNSLFYFIYSSGKLAGYFKLNESGAQTDINDPESLEIQRIYVSKQFQGQGIGSILLKEAINIAAERHKAYVWLGVWEKNEKALAFYKKNGFYEIGKHSFFMGAEEQTDYILRKDLDGNQYKILK